MASFIKTQYRKIRPTLRFVGRHFFTLCVFGLFLSVIFSPDSVNWKMLFIELSFASAFDSWKMKLKFNGGASQPFMALFGRVQEIEKKELVS